MRPRRLVRAGAAPPARLLHLGLGNFFRAHPCWYTAHSGDAAEWGVAAFTGRASERLADALNAQGGLYTLTERGSQTDSFEVLSCLVRAYPAANHGAWLRYFASPALAAVTVTVTEAGYARGANGGLDDSRADVRADVQSLRRDPAAPVRTAPARLVAGLAARRRADGGPVAIIPCDNITANGAVTLRVIGELAERVDVGLAGWLAGSVAVVSTVVDRITPRTRPADLRAVRSATGLDDRCPVVTEPFREWVLSGAFPAGRPRWEDAGAIISADVMRYEQRKLWLLNGAHSLLAYAGSILGHATVAGAFADEACRGWVDQWWAVASPHLDQPADELSGYLAVLVGRLSNARIGDRLDRIAADGSQKLPIRVVPVLRAERAAGRLPPAATRILAAWIAHLRGFGVPVDDARAAEVVPLAAGPLGGAVPRLLGWLDPALGDDADVAAMVAGQVGQFAAVRVTRSH